MLPKFLLKKFLIIFFIIKVLILRISCEECGCTNVNNENECLSCNKCKYFYKDKKCIECTLSLNTNNDYYILRNQDETYSCEVISIDNTNINSYKLIYGTKEVIEGNCPNIEGNYKYQLGNICYKSQPTNSIIDDSISGNENIYKCKHSFYKETKNFEYFNCFSTDNCPSNFKYYQYGTKECLNSCGTTLKKEQNGETTIFRCNDECINGSDNNNEFLYETDDNIKYCLDKCPSEFKYYYTDSNIRDDTPKYKCLNKCNNNHFAKDNECIENCSNYKIILDTEQLTYSCASDCPSNFPYSFVSGTSGSEEHGQSYCLKSCEDTFKESLFGQEAKKTYRLEKKVDSNIVKSCESNQPEGTYYKDETLLQWVEDCKISPSGPFHDNDSCKNSCNNYDCVTSDSFECINVSQSTNYYIYEIDEGDNICYLNCPEYLGKGFYDSDKKCISCSIGQGFYHAGDKKCYNSCSDINTDNSNSIQFYINDGDNYCFENGCTNNPLYKYYKYEETNPNPIKCYQSCFNITGTKYEKDNICFENPPSKVDDYYFYKKDDFTKYTKNADECLKFGFIYLNGNTKECIKDCENFKILPKENELGNCTGLENCKTEIYKYYNNTSMICSDICEAFIIVDKEGNLLTNEENCKELCPNDYCEDAKNKRCYKECKNYYIQKIGDSEKKIYVDKCNKYYYKESENVNKCVDVCSKMENDKVIYTYYLDDYECIDNCPRDETDSLYFSYDTKNDHQPCLEKCKNNEYYYQTSNPIICLKECEDYYSSSNKQICVKSCNQDEYIHPGNICTTSPCPTNAPFFIPLTINEPETYKVYKCVTNCEENPYKYYNVNYTLNTLLSNQCIEQCGGYIYNGGCYEKCPTGLYLNKKSNDEKFCVTNCTKYFFKNDEGIYECTNSCNTQYPYLASSGECVKRCPINEIFIGNDNKCLSTCENNIYKFYELLNSESESDTLPTNYKCIESCYNSETNKIYMEGSKECINECNDYLYINGNEQICYKKCLSNKDASFSTINESSKKVCSNECLKEDEKNYLNDKICVSGCNSLPNNIINNFDNSCVSSCNLTSNYKYLQREADDDTSALHCKEQCDTNLKTKRFMRTNYICIEKCEAPNNYVVEDTNDENVNECLNKCPDTKPYMRENTNGEYICSETECDNYYYMDTKICLSECNLYSYEKEGKNYCVNSCDFFKEKRYYFEDNRNKICVSNCFETTKQYTKINGYCDTDCADSEFHNENEYICMTKCPNGSKNSEGKICKKCENLSPSQYIDENENCIDDCANSNYIYHNKDEYKCLIKCDEDKLIEDNVCKDNCEDKLYINDNICLDNCPPNKRFFVEDSENKTCLNDCPNNYPFYYVSGNFFSCKNDCDAYVQNPDPKMNAKLCLGELCNEHYSFYVKDENNKKICYNQCPSSQPFYIEEVNDQNHCYDKCPEEYIHLSGDYKCIPYSECKNPNKINYLEKECVEQCSKNDKIFENGDLTFCLIKCDNITESMKGNNEILKLSFDNKCVFNCPLYSDIDESNNKCICPRLFYYNKTTGYKTCLNPDLTLCETVTNFPIIKIGQNECIDYCDEILSLSGFECYNNSYECEQNQTLVILTNGNKKCECKDKYYTIIENERHIKKCLGENEECPLSYPLLIQETKECVKECPNEIYNKKYGKTCVSSCPSPTIENNSNNICECGGKWYISDNYDVICITGECPNDKELYVEETKQCVSSCIGTGSEVYFNKTCIKNCDGKDDRTKVNSNGDPKMKDISSEYCRCNNPWYYDINGYEVCKGENADCNSIDELSFKYIITATKQCTNECPDDYPYSFNDKCLLDCGNELIKNEELKTCNCQNLWKYNENNKIECLNLNSCPSNYLLINSIKECYEGTECPKADPLLFNNVCYKINNCPTNLNTKYDEINQKCVCEDKWFKNTDTNSINCLSKNSKCPADYPYLEYETNECKKNKDEFSEALHEFNNIFYRNCPEKTKLDEESNKCICDDLLGFWYDIQDNEGNSIIKCGEKVCPDIKKYIEFQKKECISSCTNEYPYLYQGICYKKCPELTEVISNNECQLKTVDNEISLDNLEKTMTENIVDLYRKSNSNLNSTSVGQKIVTQKATVEFYGVNRKNKGHANQDIKSDLSYIDISECIDKIYKSNNMDEEQDIVILKFDMNNIPNKFLINPVEYKLVNSKTGQELDASICEHNSIKISYPVHDLINKYDRMTKKLRLLEYMKITLTSNNKDSLREKIDKGKEIIEDYPDTDIFNINDNIYSDICMSVEVDGKDLVLEDRINYFYPQLSLCENNCTYNRTDFINERIYCDCSYKTEFDFQREYSSSFELNLNEIENNQKSNSNIVVLKCMSNLKNTKSLSKNGGFIYSLIIISIEVILFLTIVFYGIYSLSLKLKNKMNKNEDNYDKVEVNVITNTKEKKTYEDNKTSERNLDNPPRKKYRDFGIEFIPQEYLFLFFNQGEKGSIKKVERDSVPFKTKYNTRILLEQKKGVNYDNINPRGPFPPEQNILVIVDSMDDDINDYLGTDEDTEEQITNKNNIVNINNNINKNRTKNNSRRSNKKDKTTEKESFKASQKPKLYQKKMEEFTITDYDPSDENYSSYDIDEDEDEPHEKGFIESLKKNQRFIKRDYDIAMQNKNTSFIETLSAEIIDKIYITKILFFTKKFDIIFLQLSVYLLCHILLLVLNTLFFDINTIKKIWNEENYPGLGYYLGYGLLACLVIWIIYKIFLCLLTNNDKIKDILKMIHLNKKYNMNKEYIINKKYQNLMWKIKLKIAIYTIIEILLLVFSFLYLTVFCTVYTGTQAKVFKAYGIALIEILIIKIIYGIALAIMRYVSLSKEKKGLYDVVLFINTYLV